MKPRIARWQIIVAALSYLIFTVIVAFGSWDGIAHMRASAESYQPLDLNDSLDRVQTQHTATTTDATQPQIGTRPLTNGVVLVVVAGMSADDVSGIPALREIYNGGAHATLLTNGLPTNPPGFGSLLTGATQEITGGAILDPQQAAAVVAGDADAIAAAQQNFSPSTTLDHVDTLFNAAHRSHSRTALFAPTSSIWRTAFNARPDLLDYAASLNDGATGQDIANAVVGYLRNTPAALTLVRLGETGSVPNTPETYSARALDINSAILTLTRSLPLERMTLVVVGDWTPGAAGSSATPGSSLSTVRDTGEPVHIVPFLMTGAAVATGDKGWAQQEDVAPTVAALLGIDPPRANEGRTIPQAISMPATDAAAKALDLASQRRLLAQAYRVQRGLDTIERIDPAAADQIDRSFSVSQRAVQLGSFDGVEDLTEPVLRFTRRDMEAAQQEWLSRDRTLRLLGVAALLVVPLGLAWLYRSAATLIGLLAALIPYIGAYGLYYGTEGKNFTFGGLAGYDWYDWLGITPNDSFDKLILAGIARALVLTGPAIIIAAVLFGFVERNRKRKRLRGRISLDNSSMLMMELRKQKEPFPFLPLLSIGLWLLLWQAYMMFLPGMWLFWRYGLTAPVGVLHPVALPDPFSLFLTIFSLTILLGAAILAPFVPLVLTVVYAIVRRLFFRERKSAPEQLPVQKPRRPVVTAAADSAITDSVPVQTVDMAAAEPPKRKERL